MVSRARRVRVARFADDAQSIAMDEAPRVDWRLVVMCAVVLSVLFTTQTALTTPTTTPAPLRLIAVRQTILWGLWVVLARTPATMHELFDVVVAGMREAREIFTPEQINEFPPLLRSSFDIHRLMAARPTAGFDPQW